MHAITTTSEHIAHSTKMHRSLARFSRPEASNRIPSLADFITTTSGFRVFGTHNGSTFDAPVAPADPMDGVFGTECHQPKLIVFFATIEKANRTWMLLDGTQCHVLTRCCANRRRYR